MGVHTLLLIKHMDNYTELDVMRGDYLRYLYTRPPHETIQRMVDYTTRLQQVLISHGYATDYTPTWDEYSQKVTIQLNGVDGGIGRTTGITVNVFRLAIINLLPEESDISVHTVAEAVTALEGAITRWRALYREMLSDIRRRRAIVNHCKGCHYADSQVQYCGIGNVLDAGCIHHTVMEVIG